MKGSNLVLVLMMLNLLLGEMVELSDNRKGVVKYIGKTVLGDEEMLGIELEKKRKNWELM
jgi:dynactin complex subunit